MDMARTTTARHKGTECEDEEFEGGGGDEKSSDKEENMASSSRSFAMLPLAPPSSVVVVVAPELARPAATIQFITTSFSVLVGGTRCGNTAEMSEWIG